MNGADPETDEHGGDGRGTRLRRWLWERLARMGRITRWEITRSAGTVDRKTIAIVVAMGLLVSVVGLSVVDDGDAGLEDEIYVVGVDEESPYATVAAESDQFRHVPLDDVVVDSNQQDANVDLVVTDSGEGTAGVEETRVTLVPYGDTGGPAADTFRDAVEAHNQAVMADEPDSDAAFPVNVTIEYHDRAAGGAIPGEADGEDDTTDDPDGGDDRGDTADGDDTAADRNGDDDRDENGDTVDDGDDTAADRGGDDDREENGDAADDGGIAAPVVGGDAQAETPGAISPPFPFESLVLAFLFVVPMNFVIQAYGSTIMDERIKRRGELLLVSPASRYEIVAGKTLPYLGGLVAIATVIALVVGGGPLSVAAAIPIALLFLSATFVGAMLARSFKELTFVTVTISVFLTTYTFVPAIFTDVTPIALISPLTIVVMDLQGEPVRLVEYLFSTGPFYASSAVFFLLGIGLYREEDMFDQKPVPAKLLDAIAGRVHGYRSVFALPILFIPFVFAAQLLTISLLFAIPEWASLPAIIVLAAAIEEFAKSIHVYAGFARSRFEATLKLGVVLGAIAGVGFFVGEKVTHVAQFVGLPGLTEGAAAFGPALSGSPLVVLAIFLAPLALHVVTAIISAVGASRGLVAYAVGFLVATVVHAAYNLGVIFLVA